MSDRVKEREGAHDLASAKTQVKSCSLIFGEIYFLCPPRLLVPEKRSIYVSSRVLREERRMKGRNLFV